MDTFELLEKKAPKTPSDFWVQFILYWLKEVLFTENKSCVALYAHDAITGYLERTELNLKTAQYMNSSYEAERSDEKDANNKATAEAMAYMEDGEKSHIANMVNKTPLDEHIKEKLIRNYPPTISS